MLAQRKQIVVPSVSRPSRRKHRSLLGRLVHSRMACILLAGLAVTFILSVYVSAYARATENGYKKADLLSQLRVIRVENEALRTERDSLRQPEQIEMYAVNSGMQPSISVAYLKPASETHLARNTESGDLR